MRRARAALDQATVDLLVRASQPHPGGFCRLDRGALAAAPREIGLRALAAVLASSAVPATGRGSNAWRGCSMLSRPGPSRSGAPWAAAGWRHAPTPSGWSARLPRWRRRWRSRPIRGVSWDRRFLVYAEGPLPRGATVGGLGPAGLAAVRAGLRAEPGNDRLPGRLGVPAIGLPGLPAIRDLDGVLAVPHLNYCRQGLRTDTIPKVSILPDPVAALVG